MLLRDESLFSTIASATPFRYHEMCFVTTVCKTSSIRGLAEDREDHPVARPDAEPRGGAAIQLDDGAYRRRRGDRIERTRHRALMDIDDMPGRIDEQHVERDQRVLHPHRRHRRRLVVEQHPGIAG